MNLFKRYTPKKRKATYNECCKIPENLIEWDCYCSYGCNMCDLSYECKVCFKKFIEENKYGI